ncbi:MAG: hypothetical protein KF893_11805 [Caldilineaceae bacterium]|nr:hypothetical protein [Caldilineaceae bacterium]
MNYFTPYIHIHNQQKDQQRQQEKSRNRNEKANQWSVDLNRLLSAAVVNQRFCQLLLTEPATALALGFNGESFALPTEEESLVLSIRATTLQSFTQQLLALHRNGSGHLRQMEQAIELEESIEGHQAPRTQIRSLATVSI